MLGLGPQFYIQLSSLLANRQVQNLFVVEYDLIGLKTIKLAFRNQGSLL